MQKDKYNKVNVQPTLQMQCGENVKETSTVEYNLAWRHHNQGIHRGQAKGIRRDESSDALTDSGQTAWQNGKMFSALSLTASFCFEHGQPRVDAIASQEQKKNFDMKKGGVGIV